MLRRPKVLVLPALLLLMACARHACSQDKLHFEVAVIRPSASSSPEMGMSFRNGVLETHNLYLKSIVTSAYGIREALISGLPGWAESERYDITAKVAPEDAARANALSRSERRELIASLLEDRFHLKTHTETRVTAIFEMVAAPGGIRFHESDTAMKDGTRRPTDQVSVADGRFEATNSRFLMLTAFLEETLDRNISDKTGLNGHYDIRLRWNPEDSAQTGSDTQNPDLLTALQEQLGLRLTRGRGPVEGLAVDHIDRPSPD